MKLINILLLALLAIVPYATSTVHAACDSSCMHRLLYRTAYSSGTTSIKHTMYAYDVFNWCSKDEKDWCPEAIDTTISAVTGRVINSLDIDYDNCDDKCLLSALATVAEKTALYSMQWAEHTFTTSGHYDQDRIQKLHRSVVELITVTPVEVDSGKLNEVMVNKPDLHKPHHQKDKDLAAALPFLAVPLALLSPFAAEALCTNDPVLCNTRTLDYIRRLFDGMKKLLPKSNWLRFMAEAEATGATSCGSSFGEWVDPLNENAPIDPWDMLSPDDVSSVETTNPYGLPTIPEEDETLPEESTPDEAPVHDQPEPATPETEGEPPVPIDDAESAGDSLGEEFPDDASVPGEEPYHYTTEPGEPPVPIDDEVSEPYIPTDENVGEPPVPVEDAPLPPSSPGEAPVEPLRMFRAEKYDVFNNRLEQQTLRQVTNEAEAAQLLAQSGRHFPSARFQPFQQLDAEGNVMRTIWRNPAELQPLEGEWTQVGDRFMRVSQGAPALDSMGEPLVANAAGTMLTAEAAVAPGGGLNYRMFNPDGTALDGAFDAGEAAALASTPANVPVAPPVVAPPPAGAAPPNTPAPGSGLPHAGLPHVGSPGVGLPGPWLPGPGLPFFGLPGFGLPGAHLFGGDDDDDDDNHHDQHEEDHDEHHEEHHEEHHDDHHEKDHDDDHEKDHDDDHKKDHDDDHKKDHEDDHDHNTSHHTTSTSTKSHHTTSTSTKSHHTTSTSTKPHHTTSKSTKSHHTTSHHTTSTSKSTSTSSTPTTFITKTKSSKSTSTLDALDLAMMGPTATITNIPQECMARGMVLDDLDKHTRKDCDKKLEDLERAEKKIWVHEVMPTVCMSSDDWNPADMHGDDGELCRTVVRDFNHDERKVWLAGMLPAECPYDHDEEKEFDLDHDMKKSCKELKHTLEKGADLD
ncbi:hypothetical protein LTR37_001982 [Vermiconidia calcicola]|uniref:Uncharacterized protein n=1 Tax=Vermiconidia calcicola TaxID=1690605 RepID=A0ACC3NUQ0_9PEZI|nr:hypothetical protein LTR37_001982 [Vermiconidia calcicola]